jgi:hypothetical protein
MGCASPRPTMHASRQMVKRRRGRTAHLHRVCMHVVILLCALCTRLPHMFGRG